VLVGGADQPPAHRQVEHRPDPLEPPQHPPRGEDAVVVELVPRHQCIAPVAESRSRRALRASEQWMRVPDFVRSLDADHGSRKSNYSANFA
jgi:hypothetical protein